MNLPIVWTGTAASNACVDADIPVQDGAASNDGIVFFQNAPFYTSNFSLTYTNIAGSTTTLVEGTDFEFFLELVKNDNPTNVKVYGAIRLLYTKYTGTLTASYQALGGNIKVNQGQVLTYLGTHTYNANVAKPVLTSYPALHIPENNTNIWPIDSLANISTALSTVGFISLGVEFVSTRSDNSLDTSTGDSSRSSSTTISKIEGGNTAPVLVAGTFTTSLPSSQVAVLAQEASIRELITAVENSSTTVNLDNANIQIANAAQENGGNLEKLTSTTGNVTDTAYAGTGDATIASLLRGIFNKLGSVLQIRQLTSNSDSVTVVPSGTQDVRVTNTVVAQINNLPATQAVSGAVEVSNLNQVASESTQTAILQAINAGVNTRHLASSTDSVKVEGGNAVAIKVDNSEKTQPVSAESLPLPTNAAKETGGNLDIVRTSVGTTSDPAFAGTGPSTFISLMKGVYAALTGTINTRFLNKQNDSVTIEGGNAVGVKVEGGNTVAVKVDAGGTTLTVQGHVTSDIGTTGGLALDSTVQSLINVIKTTASSTSSVWCDETVSPTQYYVRRESLDNNNNIVVAWETTSGLPATPNVSVLTQAADNANLSSENLVYVAKTSTSEYSVDDILVNSFAINTQTSVPTVEYNIWFNASSGDVLTSAPIANTYAAATQRITADALPLPTNAAKESGGNLDKVASGIGQSSDAAWDGSSQAGLVSVLKAVFNRLASLNDIRNLTAAKDTVKVEGGNTAAIKVDGSATTQPVSLTAVPLANNAATESGNLAVIATATGAPSDAVYSGTGNGTLVGILKSIRAVLVSTLNIRALSSSTDSVTIQGGNTTAVKVDASATTQPISAAALPLPAGAATETGNLAAIKAATGTVGDAAYTGSGSGTLVSILKGIQAAFGGVLNTRTLSSGTDSVTTVPSGTQAVSISTVPLPTGAATEDGNLAAIKATTGGIADAAWSGTGNGTNNSVLKAIVGKLSTALTIRALSSATDTVKVEGGNSTAVKVDNSGVTQPVSGHVTVDLVDTNGLAKDASIQTLITTIKNQNNITSSVWVDTTTAPDTYYVRRELIDGNGTVTISFETLSGAAATPNVANLIAASQMSALSVQTVEYVAAATATGYNTGDLLIHSYGIDVGGGTPTLAFSVWFNATQSTTLASAPPSTAYVASASNSVSVSASALPTNAAKETGGNLDAISAAVGTPGASTYAGSGNTTLVGVMKGVFAVLSNTLNTRALTSGTDTVKVEGGNTAAVKTDGSATTQPISASALPLPTGAATESGNLATLASTTGAKSDAAYSGTGDGSVVALLKSIAASVKATLNTRALSSATDSVTIQGGNSTAVKVDNSAVTQPVSASALPLPANAAQENGGNLASINSTIGTAADSAYAGSGNATVLSVLKGVFAALKGTLSIRALSSGTDSITTVPSGTQAVSVSSLPLPSGAATEGGNLATIVANTATSANAQGTSATGITQMTGGAGILGWLSGIYSKLSNTLTVSVSSLPSLPAGSNAIGTVGVTSLPALPTGANTIGSVNVLGGNTTAVKVDGSATTQPVSAVALPLPANAAKETGGNLATVVTNTGSSGAIVSALNSVTSAIGAGNVSPDNGTGLAGWLQSIKTTLDTAAYIGGGGMLSNSNPSTYQSINQNGNINSCILLVDNDWTGVPWVGKISLYTRYTGSSGLMTTPVKWIKLDANGGGTIQTGDIVENGLYRLLDFLPADSINLDTVDWVSGSAYFALIGSDKGINQEVYQLNPDNLRATVKGTVAVSASALPANAAQESGGNLAAISASNTLIANASGTPADTAFTGTGSGTIISLLKGVFVRLGNVLTVNVNTLPSLPAGSNNIGSVNVANFPATQPVSLASVPLPTGAATETTVASINTTNAAINTAVGATTDSIYAGSGNSTLIGAVKGVYAAIKGSLNIRALTSGTDSVSAVVAQLPASLGQKAATASTSVVLASDQSAVSVTSSGGALALDSSIQTLIDTIKTKGSTSSSVWIDKTVTPEAYYVRRETYDSSGNVVIAFETLSGASATPTAANLVPADSDDTLSVQTTQYLASSSGTGYSANDVLIYTFAMNVRNPAAPSVVYAYWYNATTSAVLSTVPASGTYAQFGAVAGGGGGGASSVTVTASALPTNAAQESGGNLDNIAYSIGTTSDSAWNGGSLLTGTVIGVLKSIRAVLVSTLNTRALTAATDTVTIQGGNSTAVKVDGSSVTQPVSVSSLPLPSGAALESGGNLASISTNTSNTVTAMGSGATGVTMPSGGVGLMGWLSGIYSKLSSALTVTVNSLPALPAGTNNIGKVDINSLPSLPAGSNSIGTVAATQSGTWALSGQATTAAPTYTNGTANLLSLTTSGALRVDASGTTQPVQIQAGSNAIGSVSVSSLPTLPAGTNNIGKVDVNSLPALPTGSNTIGNVGVTSLPSLPAGSNAIGTVAVTSLPAIPAGSNAIGSVSVTSLPALPAGANTIGTVNAVQSGTWAHSVQGSVTATAPTYTAGTTQTVSLTTSGAMRVDGSGVTQPVSLASLPALPAGSNNIGSVNSLQSGSWVMSGAVTTNAPAYTTGTNQALSLTTAGAMRVDASATTQPISAAALPLPSGAATEATLAAINTSNTTMGNATGTTADSAYAGSGTATMIAALKGIYAAIKSTLTISTTQLPTALGSQTSANSLSVTLASDDGVSSASGSITEVNANLSTGIATTGSTVAITLNIASTLSITCTAISATSLYVQVSNDNTYWYTLRPMNTATGALVAAITETGAFQADVAGFLYARVTSYSGTSAAVQLRAISDSSAMVGLDAPLPAGTNTIGTVLAPTITKGTQDSNGFTVQELKDAGRNQTNFFMVKPVVSTATDTLQSLTGHKGGAAVSATTTPAVVTAGKRYRIVNIEITYVGVATLGYVVVTLRANTAGAVALASPAVQAWSVGATSATAGSSQTLSVPIPDGMEFAAGTGIGVSVQGFGATGTATAVGYVSVSINGFEY